MLEGKSIGHEMRELIVRLYNDGMSKHTIARTLKKSRTVVRRAISSFERDGRLTPKPKPGRPRKPSVRDDRGISRLCEVDCFRPVSAVAAEARSSGIDVSRKTAARRLSERGLHARRPAKKPALKARNQRARLEFARRHRAWTVEQWSKVLFSDESTFVLRGRRSHAYVRRRTGESLLLRAVRTTTKHVGGSLMVWGAMSAAGPGPLVRISGRMDSHYYREVVRAHVLLTIAATPAGAIFQQDGASVHAVIHVLRFLDDSGIERMAWPAQLSDLSPIENLWQHFKVRVEQCEYATTDDLWSAITSEWESVTP